MVKPWTKFDKNLDIWNPLTDYMEQNDFPQYAELIPLFKDLIRRNNSILAFDVSEISKQ